MPNLGKIMQGYRERNFKVILDYINKYDKDRENNVGQLTQELQSIKRSCNSNNDKPFISEALLDIVKYMMEQHMNRQGKTQFKTGALSGLICEAT